LAEYDNEYGGFIEWAASKFVESLKFGVILGQRQINNARGEDYRRGGASKTGIDFFGVPLVSKQYMIITLGAKLNIVELLTKSMASSLRERRRGSLPPPPFLYSTLAHAIHKAALCWA
jgi:hypothetical protein